MPWLRLIATPTFTTAATIAGPPSQPETQSSTSVLEQLSSTLHSSRVFHEVGKPLKKSRLPPPRTASSELGTRTSVIRTLNSIHTFPQSWLAIQFNHINKVQSSIRLHDVVVFLSTWWRSSTIFTVQEANIHQLLQYSNAKATLLDQILQTTISKSGL